MTDGIAPKAPGRVRGRPFEKGRRAIPSAAVSAVATRRPSLLRHCSRARRGLDPQIGRTGAGRRPDGVVAVNLTRPAALPRTCCRVHSAADREALPTSPRR